MQTASVDWLGFSYADGVEISTVLERLGGGEWCPMARGDLGYRSGFARGHVRVLYDGQPGMGVHVEASGQGCRELEAGRVVQDWQGFLGQLLESGAHMSRLDLAVDDRAGLVDLQEVVRSVYAGEVVSRYRGYKIDVSGQLHGSCTEGRTVYFGSAKSDTRIRMYDKAAQLGQEGHWTRVELQARDDKAEQLARVVSTRGAGAVGAVLKGLIDFKVRGAAQQRERWATADWWAAFVSTCERIRLTVERVVRSVQRAYSWLRRQAAQSLAVVVAAAEGDLADLEQLVREGRAGWRRGSWHERAVAEYRAWRAQPDPAFAPA